jgi:hypothetical protein
MDVPKDLKNQGPRMLNLLINHYRVRGYVMDPANHSNLKDFSSTLCDFQPTYTVTTTFRAVLASQETLDVCPSLCQDQRPAMKL